VADSGVRIKRKLTPVRFGREAVPSAGHLDVHAALADAGEEGSHGCGG